MEVSPWTQVRRYGPSPVMSYFSSALDRPFSLHVFSRQGLVGTSMLSTYYMYQETTISMTGLLRGSTGKAIVREQVRCNYPVDVFNVQVKIGKGTRTKP